MKKTVIIALFFFVFSGLMVRGEEIPNLTDPYILLSTDTARLQHVEYVCKQLQFPDVKTFQVGEGNLIVIGPFLHGAMAYENLRVIEKHIPLAKQIRLSKKEGRIDFVHPSAKINSNFIVDSRLGKTPTSTYLSNEYSDYYERINALKSRPDYLQQIQSLKKGLSVSDPKMGIISKFEGDYLYRTEFNKLISGKASSFKEAKALYRKLARNEIQSPREMRGHAAIRLIFIEQAENRTEVWCPNPDSSNKDAYFKVYQTCRDAYHYLDDERFKPEAAVHKIAKMLELAYRFNIGNCDDVRKAIESVKADLPSSETIRLINQSIMSDREFIVHKYRYNMSTIDLMYAETYYYEQNFQEAYRCYKKVAESYPDIPRTHLSALRWQGTLAMSFGNDDEAIHCFETVVNDKSPENNENTFGKRNPRSNSGFWLGRLYIKKGKKQEAKKLFQWILNTYPDSREREHVIKCMENLKD
ncbi:tetratricopeptide repeat protein [Candidatus Sumerlaeota bacterium]|nr:tetratricopeptide repeat protein [Candidatus Sumerlaeota bacterium]